MKCIYTVVMAVAVLAFAGCKPKARDIPPLERKEAASLASEAQFAIMLRDYARAEPLLAKAAKLSPDRGEYWLNLGITRRRLNNTSGAKAAYGEARSAFHDAFELDHADVDALVQEIYVLCLLGKADEARNRLTSAQKKEPANTQLKALIEGQRIDSLMQEPAFKEVAL